MPDDLAEAEEKFIRNLVKHSTKPSPWGHIRPTTVCSYCKRPDSNEALCQGCGAPKQ